MKKGLLFSLIVSLVFIASSAMAAPFLVSNPVFDAKSVTLNVDGSNKAGTIETLTDGSVRLHYDLANMAAGNHTVTVVADYGIWGKGPVSNPFVFAKPDVNAPLTLTIE